MIIKKIKLKLTDILNLNRITLNSEMDRVYLLLVINQSSIITVVEQIFMHCQHFFDLQYIYLNFNTQVISSCLSHA